MTPKRINEINIKIAELQQEVIDFRALPLHSILAKYPAEDFYQDVKKNRLIAYLLRRGYIDENYYDYISYFYPGVMTASDRDFVLDIKIGIKQDYKYKIYKPKAVIKQISDSEFVKGIMLNIDLVSYIVANKNQYSIQCNWITNHIRRRKEFSFIEAYYFQENDTSAFFNEILPQWSDFFNEGIKKNKGNKMADINFEILLRYFPKVKIEQYKNPDFKNYISENFEFISSKIGIIGMDKMKFVMESLGTKFENLKVGNEVSKEFISLVINGDCYKLTNENITAVLCFLNQELANKFKEASYSAILESKNENIIEYINLNINDCIIDVFSNGSVNENVSSIVFIAENDEIEDEKKKKYLSIQKNKISNLSIIGQEYWNIVIESNVVSPNWKNIELYISIDQETQLSSSIIDFIDKNSRELSLQKTAEVISNEAHKRLFLQLIGSNQLPIESYRLIKRAFAWQFKRTDLSALNPDKIEFLIETGCLYFNEFNYNLIDNHFSSFTAKFILRNKTEYFYTIASYPLKVNTAVLILNSEKLIDKEKVLIIENIPKSLLNDNSNLSNLICTILNRAEKLPVDNDFIIALMISTTSKSQSLSLFVKKCIESPYDELFVKSGLKILDGDYLKIAKQSGHRPKFSATKENKLLFKFLRRNNFISKEYEESGIIRVNARNIG